MSKYPKRSQNDQNHSSGSASTGPRSSSWTYNRGRSGVLYWNIRGLLPQSNKTKICHLRDLVSLSNSLSIVLTESQLNDSVLSAEVSIPSTASTVGRTQPVSDRTRLFWHRLGRSTSTGATGRAGPTAEPVSTSGTTRPPRCSSLTPTACLVPGVEGEDPERDHDQHLQTAGQFPQRLWGSHWCM